MRKLICSLVAIASIGLPTAANAVTLVTPNGVPIGGQWQTWANKSQVATYGGRVILAPAMPICVNPAVYGCATGSSLYPSAAYGTTFAVGVRTGVNHQLERSVLISELGHIFDWAYLDSRSRYQFATLWKTNPNTPWLDSAAGLNAGIEDGLEGSFELSYGACADGSTTPVRTSWGTGPTIPFIQFGPSTCQAINYIGQLHGARMPTTAVTVRIKAHMASRPRRHRRHHGHVTITR